MQSGGGAKGLRALIKGCKRERERKKNRARQKFKKFPNTPQIPLIPESLFPFPALQYDCIRVCVCEHSYLVIRKREM